MTIMNKPSGSSPAKESSDVLFKKGESMIQSGNLASALAFFHEMLKQSEAEGIGSQMRNRLYNFSVAIHNGAVQRNNQVGGNFYFSAGLAELDAEIAIGEMLLQYEPKAADLWSGLGLAYDNRGYCEKAERCYRRTIELDPGGITAGDAWINIGVLYRNYARTVRGKDQNGKEIEIPLAGLRKEQLFPTEKSAIAIHGNWNSPRWKTAESAFEQALSIFTKFANKDARFRTDLVKAHWNLAQLYTDLLQGSKAIPHVQAIHHLEPNNQKAIDWLKEAEQNTKKKLLD
ncbi:MAG: tetratricopeptide repeat protein [Chloroflexi bacterium]|nr:tetratricopeptide repeat protein [Chloroflexota bacterium]